MYTSGQSTCRGYTPFHTSEQVKSHNHTVLSLSRKNIKKNAVWDGCRSVSYKWMGWIGWMGWSPGGVMYRTYAANNYLLQMWLKNCPDPRFFVRFYHESHLQKPYVPKFTEVTVAIWCNLLLIVSRSASRRVGSQKQYFWTSSRPEKRWHKIDET